MRFSCKKFAVVLWEDKHIAPTSHCTTCWCHLGFSHLTIGITHFVVPFPIHSVNSCIVESGDHIAKARNHHTVRVLHYGLFNWNCSAMADILFLIAWLVTWNWARWCVSKVQCPWPSCGRKPHCTGSVTRDVMAAILFFSHVYLSRGAGHCKLPPNM